MIAIAAGVNLSGPGFTDCVVQTTQKSTAPYTCGGVTVTVNGEPAPVLSVSPTEVTFQVPTVIVGSLGLANPSAIQLTRQSGGTTLVSTPFSVRGAYTAPGIAAQLDSGILLAKATGPRGLITVSNPALPGEEFSMMTATGFGLPVHPIADGTSATPSQFGSIYPFFSVNLTMGGRQVPIVAPTLLPLAIGTYTMFGTLPLDLAAGYVPVVVSAGSAPLVETGATVYLPVGTPKVTITGVSNGASGVAGVASGSWMSIYGTNLAPARRTWQAADFTGNLLPTSLEGVTVTVNGKSAAVYYISPGQINVQAPADTAAGPVEVQVKNMFGSATGTANLQSFAPGFFTLSEKYAAAVHSDGSLVLAPIVFGNEVAARPAKPGETILIFGTGFGPTNPTVPAGLVFTGSAPLVDPNQLRVRIGGLPAVVQLAGLVAAGEYQINVVVPALADGEQPLVADVGGVSSQSGVVVLIKN